MDITVIWNEPLQCSISYWVLCSGFWGVSFTQHEECFTLSLVTELQNYLPTLLLLSARTLLSCSSNKTKILSPNMKNRSICIYLDIS